MHTHTHTKEKKRKKERKRKEKKGRKRRTFPNKGMPHAICGFELLSTEGSCDIHSRHPFTLVPGSAGRMREPLVCLGGLQMNGEHALPVEPHIFLINHTGLPASCTAACRTIALQAQHCENSRCLCTHAFSLQLGTSFLRAETLLYFFGLALLCLSLRNPPSS